MTGGGMMSNLKRKTALRLTISAVIIVLTALCLIGVTAARIRQSAESEKIKLKYSFASDSVHIQKNGSYSPPDGWSEVSGDKTEYELSFVLSNAATDNDVAKYSQTAYVEVFVTEGAGDGVSVTLAADGRTVEGSYREAEEGSAIYEKYGAGRVYGFVNPSGDMYTWAMPAGSAVFVPMTLTVSGEAANPAAVTVIACGIPS